MAGWVVVLNSVQQSDGSTQGGLATPPHTSPKGNQPLPEVVVSAVIEEQGTTDPVIAQLTQQLQALGLGTDTHDGRSPKLGANLAAVHGLPPGSPMNVDEPVIIERSLRTYTYTRKRTLQKVRMVKTRLTSVCTFSATSPFAMDVDSPAIAAVQSNSHNPPFK